jgi:pimeloyl-ACP methyl ester carboxylesterase
LDIPAAESFPDLRVARVLDRTVELVLRGEGGGPTVVLESGLGDDLTSWGSVFGALAKRARTLVYSRAGLGRSTPGPAPRDLPSEVRELRQLLAALGQKPPYLLVGHSWGGLIVQAFAASDRQDVAGMLLVDSAHPDLIERVYRDTPEDGRAFDVAASQVYGPVARQELDALSAPGGGHFAGEDAPYDGPTIILGAWMFDFNQSLDFRRHHRIRIQEIAQRYPHAELRKIFCAHHIQRERPLAVIDAVEELLARIRSAGRDGGASSRV